MPLDTGTLARMRFKLLIAIGAVLCQAIIIVKLPKLGQSIISTCGKKFVVKWGPLHVKDVAAVSFEQRCVCIEVFRSFCIEDCNRRGRTPRQCNHFTVGGDTVVLVCVVHLDAIVCDQRIERQVLECLSDRIVRLYHFSERIASFVKLRYCNSNSLKFRRNWLMQEGIHQLPLLFLTHVD